MSKPKHENRQQPKGRPRRAQKSSFWRGPGPIFGSTAAVVLLIVLFVLISRLQSPPSGNTAPTADPTVIAEITHVSASVTDAVGTGGLPNPLSRTTGATTLTGSGGRPEVLYIGAEWCPYCAAERWAMVVALSRFGTFSGLSFTTSSSSDVFPDTHTVSFNGSSFQSSSIDFVPVELEDRNRNRLQTPTSQQNQIWQTYDPQGSIPFLDLGNRYTAVGRGVPPDPLQGLSWQQIAAALTNPGSPVTKAIVGNANYLTAAICQLAGTQAAAACSSPTIKQIAAQLGG
jgi:thiol-disulfide isomerase/thioredoxin